MNVESFIVKTVPVVNIADAPNVFGRTEFSINCEFSMVAIVLDKDIAPPEPSSA